MIKQNLMLGNTGDRREHDFYPTPADVTIALMDFLKLDPCKIWEPAAGNGAMVKVLQSYGHEVIATDLQTGDDFLRTIGMADAIITNPPFNLSQDFIVKALQDAPIVAMVLKSQYWHAKKRHDLFKQNPPAWILPLTWRPDFGGGGAPVMEIQWTVWIKGNTDCKYVPLEKPIVRTNAQLELDVWQGAKHIV